MAESTPASDRVVSDVGPFAVVPEWLLVDRPVSDRAVRLYALLALMADRGTRQAYPARKTLAHRLNCSLDSVDRAVEELAAAGAVTKRERYRDGRRERSSNLYVVHLSPRGVAAPLRPPSRTAAATGSRTGAAPRTRTRLNQEEAAREAVLAVAPELAEQLSATKASAVAAAVNANQAGVERCYRKAMAKGDDPARLFMHLIAEGEHLAKPTSSGAHSDSFAEYELGAAS